MQANAQTLRPVLAQDRDWIATTTGPIGGPKVVSGRRVHDLTKAVGVLCICRGKPQGVVLWHDHQDVREILALVAEPTGRGIGHRLITAALDDARALGLSKCRSRDNRRQCRCDPFL